MEEALEVLTDPLKFQQFNWPHVRFYDKQLDIIYSVRDNDETYVPAGNGLGKDFVSAFIVLWFFCSRRPCRVITTSVDHEQLKGVLWGEMRRFIQTSKYPLPIQVNDLFIRHVNDDGVLDPLSYIVGRVVKKGEGLLGHHVARTSDLLPRTLCVFDEASGVDDVAYETSDTWAHRKLVIGNPRPCTNFFKKGVKAGRLLAPDGTRLYREVIKIRAIDSPNVKVDQLRVERGLPPKNEMHVPGLVDYQLYLKRRATLDKVRQSWVLDAEFYEGAETLLFPPDWLDRAEQVARQLVAYHWKKRASEHPDWLSFRHRKIRTMGVDAAEGGDSTVWTVVDRLGIIDQYSIKTSDTNDIPGITLARARKFEIEPEDIIFDRGGGGKQHADRLRASGYMVRTVAFGEAATDDVLKGQKTRKESRAVKETSTIYKNRRAEMYGMLRILLDPGPAISDEPDSIVVRANAQTGIGYTPSGSAYVAPLGFGIPAHLEELRRQLAPLPLLYEAGEGRLYLPPKNKRKANSTEQTITDILGRSPDEADSLVLAVYGLLSKPVKRYAGAI